MSVYLQERYGGIDMDTLYKLSKQSKAQIQANKEAQKAVQNVTKPKTKSKLKAMIEQEDMASKQANRKLPLSERMDAAHTR